MNENRCARCAVLERENAHLKALLREALALIRDSVDCEYNPNSTVNERWGWSVTAQIEAALGGAE